MPERKNVLFIIAGVLPLILMAPGEVMSQSDSTVADINIPDGFEIEVWSDKVPNARSLALGDQDTVFVSTRRDSRVYALVPQADGSPQVITIAKGLKVPNGIAYHDGDLYIAEISRIIRYRDIENRIEDIPEPEIVIDDLPDESHHGWRYIDFGPDGQLYISIGAPCNVCDREGFGNISKLSSDGSHLDVVANGVRNSVGFTWHPQSGELWFTDNGRDMLGDDIPPGEVNKVSAPGQHFGFPYCHAGEILDPEFGSGRKCSDYVAPQQKLGPHVAPLGLMFYGGSMFPDEYQGQLFVAEHGSWNRSQKIGYRISLVRVENSVAVAYETFADGWLQGDDVSGRPVDILELRDGSLLVSDDKGGRVYRISYSRPLSEGVGAAE